MKYYKGTNTKIHMGNLLGKLVAGSGIEDTLDPERRKLYDETKRAIRLSNHPRFSLIIDLLKNISPKDTEKIDIYLKVIKDSKDLTETELVERTQKKKTDEPDNEVNKWTLFLKWWNDTVEVRLEPLETIRRVPWPLIIIGSAVTITSLVLIWVKKK